MENIVGVETVLWLAKEYGVTALTSLALLDMILGILVAVNNGEFKLFYVGNILQKLAPMLIAYIAVTLLLQNSALSAAIVTVSAAHFTGSVVKNIGFLFPGIGQHMPDALIQPEWHRAGYGAATEARLERAVRTSEVYD